MLRSRPAGGTYPLALPGANGSAGEFEDFQGADNAPAVVGMQSPRRDGVNLGQLLDMKSR